MTSLRARLVNATLRATFKRADLHEAAPAAFRRKADRAFRLIRPRGARESVETPVRGAWSRGGGAAAARSAGRAILYIHGGGFVVCSPTSHARMTDLLARRAKTPLFSLDYRLAPEHPCPAGVEDAVAGFDYLLSLGLGPGDVVVAGDSAGGGLAAALAQALTAAGRAPPAGLILFSPALDLTGDAPSWRENVESDCFLTPEILRAAADHYAGGLAKDDPRVSPLFGPLEALPPTRIYVSADELLRDDALRLRSRAEAAGRTVSCEMRDGLVHAWPAFHPAFPEAARTIGDAAAFARARFNG
ncbi:MAG: alpha/beta hydrolase fold domain-containing protein [Parvularculaceae bacterium]